MTAEGTWISQFPGNFVWSNAAMVTKGMAPYGAVALGEIDEVCERLRHRQGEPDAWREEWCAMGRRLEGVAAAAAAAGRQMTAGNYYLRAGMYYFTGHTLHAAVGSPGKHLKVFTLADGTTYHAQADNRQVGVDYIADWISANL